MVNQKSQDNKRKVQNNTEWLDELINKIESTKNRISNILFINPSFFILLNSDKLVTFKIS